MTMTEPTEEELDEKYGEGLNAEGQPREKQTLEIHSGRLGLTITAKENEDGKDSA